MLLTQFQEVSRIDARITKIHKELIELYKQRDAIAEGKAPYRTITATKPTVVDELRTLYDKLAAAWLRYDCTIPTYKYLKPKLARAQRIITELQASNPMLRSLQVVLVPPSSALPFPTEAAFRERQTAIEPDYASPELAAAVTPDTKWHVLVVDADVRGIDLGAASDIIAAKTYLIAGHDTRALGPREYAALTLQLGAEPMLDMDSWTMFLKDVCDGTLHPSATFAGGRFRFELDELDGALGDNRFRPAVEV